MMDAYAHLDMSQVDPVATLDALAGECGLDRILMVETWDGRNRSLLEKVSHQPVALCWRGEPAFPPQPLAARVKCSMLGEAQSLLDSLEANRQYLLLHGDTPIASWSRELCHIAEARPGLRIYLPHLGWPAFDARPSPGWALCLADIAVYGNVLLGVSAIEHFSREFYPHEDVKILARLAMKLFGQDRVVAASDYPLFAKGRYCDYMRLTEAWMRDLWPDWSDDNALRP